MKDFYLKKIPKKKKKVSQLFSVYGTLVVLVNFFYSISRSKEIPKISFIK